MKTILSLLLAAVLLSGCSSAPVVQVTEAPTTADTAVTQPPVETIPAPSYTSRFSEVTAITLSDDGITCDSDGVYTSNDIVYYEDKTTYESGNPYGQGEAHERHSAEETAAHTVVNITAPGAYRLTGTLSAGQIRVDLGVTAYEDPSAVVELILDNVDITCTVAPAIVFVNTYECDGNWSADTAKPDVDTSAAGANLILEGRNTVSGSHVAKIFKDKEGEKKLWKQDGAIYSYMSMNVFGPGSLELTADNEGLDTELHLTINGGDIRILSDNDGINTNEDGVSVTTINGGNLTIYAGLGAEGDGIDSNGYLVINGGFLLACAKPISDAGLDSDLGSFIHGGTVIAMGSAMDWAESDSRQVTMNLQFASRQKAGSEITITKEDGTEIFRFASDSEYDRGFSGLILSHPQFTQGSTCHIYVDGVQMAYTGSDLGGFGPGGFGGFGGGQRPEGMEPGQMPEGMEPPQDFDPFTFESFQPGEKPADFNPGNMPQDFQPGNMPEGFDPGNMPSDIPQGGRGDFDPENRPADFKPQDEMPQSTFPGTSGEPSTSFYLSDKVNAFSGLTPA